MDQNEPGVIRRELRAVPFAARHRESDSNAADATMGLLLAASRDPQLRVAIVYLDIPAFNTLAKTMDKQRLSEIAGVAKRSVRYALTQFGGAEFDKSQGFGMVFERPVDAVAYALNLQETLSAVSHETGANLLARVAIHFDLVHIKQYTETDAVLHGKRMDVTGEGLDVPRRLMRVAIAGQILSTRGAFDMAKSSAPGNASIPKTTQWARYGRVPVQSLPPGTEICEVGRVGLAPFQLGEGLGGAKADETMLPGMQKTASVPTAGQTLKMAFQYGAAQFTAARSASASSPTGKPVAGFETTIDTSPADLASMVGMQLGSYRLESVKEVSGDRISFVARDLEMEQDVLLRMLPESKANKPEKRMRFLREGITAMFLRHPNFVAAREVESYGMHLFIIYDLVQGSSLQEMVDSVGALQPRVALGYTLQVARGLQKAHECGIVHRDIRPKNILVSTQGVIKITGLGLAKITKDSDAKRSDMVAAGDDAPLFQQAMGNLTAMNTTLGKPEYIAPEQARDASTVDHRADQFSLGCLLYFLLTGETPYTGTSVLEIQSKQARGVYTPVSKQIEDCPADLDGFMAKLLQLEAAKRFPSMAEVIVALEKIQGIRTEVVAEKSVSGAVKPAAAATDAKASEGANPLREACESYYRAPWMKVRLLVLLSWIALPLLAVSSVSMGFGFQIGAALLGLWLLIPAFHLLIDGIIFKNPLFLRIRRLFAHPSMAGIITMGVLFGGVLVFLYLLGLMAVAAVIALISLGLAILYQLVVELPLRMQRSASIHKAEAAIKILRTTGTAEEVVQRRVVKASGADWEEFFEDLFGYESMVAARQFVDEMGEKRHRHAGWRDAIAGWLLEIEAHREEARAKRQLEKAEVVRLQESGVSKDEARAQAMREAERIIAEERRQMAAMQMPMGHGAASMHPQGAPFMGSGFGPPRMDYYSRAGSGGPIHGILTMVRSAIGGGIMLAALLPMASKQFPIPVPPLVQGWLVEYYKWGWGGNIVVAMLLGGAIMRQATSRRYVTSMLACIGALLIVAAVPIVALVNQPQFDMQTSIFCGLVLCLGPMLLRRMTSVGGMRMLMPF